jgi:hypothetical protein
MDMLEMLWQFHFTLEALFDTAQAISKLQIKSGRK